MSMDLERKNFSYAPDYLIADGAEINTAVKVASVGVVRGEVVVLNGDGKLAKIIVSGDDPYTVTTTGLYGIVADDAAAEEETVVYLTGAFFGDALVLPENATVADVEVPLRNLGIFVK